MIRIGFFLLLVLFCFSVSAVELSANPHFFCTQKTATGVEVRNIRVHKFPEEKKCAVIYSIKGQDEIVSQGTWLTFCNKKARQVADNLQKGLWKCKKMETSVFYSFSLSGEGD